MIAEALGITADALRHYERRHQQQTTACKRGRPEMIDANTREKIRQRFIASHKQWGPQVLVEWCRRKGLGSWSASTVAKVIEDLHEPESESLPARRYEITRSQVMWSEDGTSFGKGRRKQELLVAQDEHARLKLADRLVEGPATASDVVHYLGQAFDEYGAPLVLKHDGGKVFDAEEVRALLDEWQVVDLTAPRHWPGYNGKQERSMRDIKSMERALRKDGVGDNLRERVDITLHDLNEERPRPVLGGCTAREVYERDLLNDVDRAAFLEEIEDLTETLRAAARSRSEEGAARRHAVEAVLSNYGLLLEVTDSVN
jgi:hypothetical protein